MVASISHATVDRLLKLYKDYLKKRYRINPFSSNLKKSIKVGFWFDKSTAPSKTAS